MTASGQVRSFDVFDTVLTRRVGDPDAVFRVLGDRLASAGEIATTGRAFAAARRHSEQRLRRLLDRQATLREIYDHVAEAHCVPSSQAEVWAGLEEQLERELTIPVPGAQRLLDEARADHARVVFVSDTPHREPFVAELLRLHGLAGPDDLVFTSADRRVSKSHGGLFEVVADVLGEGHTFTHLGDSVRSDLAAPRVEGWHSRLRDAAQLSRYESLLGRHADDTDGLTSWIAGASRQARLEAREQGVPSVVADVAAGVLGPFLVGYALWTASQARLRGLRRLHYVARDGEVMLAAARHVIGRVAPDLELRYLHGSRQPWTLGAAAHDEGVRRRWVQARSDFSARTALARVGLTPEEVHAAAPSPSTEPQAADRPMSSAERDALAEALLRQPLSAMVDVRARETSERVVAYLRQQGFTDGVPSALVDAGWGGRTAGAFDRLVGVAGGDQVAHLVVGITGSAQEGRDRSEVVLVPWLFDQQTSPASVAGLHSPNVLVEMLCAGTTGRTLDYEWQGDRIEPVLEQERNEEVLAWGLEQMQATAVRVAELLSEHLPDARGADLAPVTWDLLRAFWTTPTPQEVAVWGDFPWEEEVSQPYVAVADRITAGAVAERLLRGEGTLRRNNSWRAGVAVRSRHPWRGLLRWRAWQDEHRQRLRRVPRRLRLEVARRRPTPRS